MPDSSPATVDRPDTADISAAALREEHSPSLIVYDGECIFCQNYVQFVRLNKSIGSVELLDARSDDERVKAMWRDGLDLNTGMVFRYRGETYHGDKAVWMLSQLSSGSDVFNKVCRGVFRSPTLTRAIYPAMKLGRRLTLLVRGRKLIANPSAATGLPPPAPSG